MLNICSENHKTFVFHSHGILVAIKLLVVEIPILMAAECRTLSPLG